MTTLPPTTISRLQKIPQANVVWEGDRRTLGSMAAHLEGTRNLDDQCALWIDGSEGVVRAMDIVADDMSLEGVVRTLLRAIESPHHPSYPVRPKKIVVRDREIQFFLRGVLQDLNISVEYAPELPLIDRLFEGFATVEEDRFNIPEVYELPIERVATQIWELAPWELLTDSDILQVELKDCEIERVYVCVMGMMSTEYGILLYRSLNSLKQFRSAALGEGKSTAELEKAFLAQDCWFLNYEEIEIVPLNNHAERSNMDASFGSLHPFEGMRHFLDEAEAEIVYATLESVSRFCTRQRESIQQPMLAMTKSYRIALPVAGETIDTRVSTMPELSVELIEIGKSDRPNIADEISVREDLIPDGALISLATISPELVEQLQHQPKTYCQSLVTKTSELPTILLQTTRPKAKRSIAKIKEAGGLKAVCFNAGRDPLNGELYDLGMLQTEDDELHIFAEYPQKMLHQAQALKEWQQSCRQTEGYCGVAIAMGAKGINRGNPKAKDILALFQVKSIDGAELGMGILQLMSSFDL